MLLNCGVGEDLDCKEIKLINPKGNQSWIFIGRTDAEAETPNTVATWCEGLTHLKRPWCWERLRAGGEGDDRGWDGWMASPIRWTWVWVNSGSWWWTGRPGVLRFMGLQRVGHDWVTELNTISWLGEVRVPLTKGPCPSNLIPLNPPFVKVLVLKTWGFLKYGYKWPLGHNFRTSPWSFLQDRQSCFSASGLCGCGRKKMAPQRCFPSNPRHLWICYITWKKEFCKCYWV